MNKQIYQYKNNECDYIELVVRQGNHYLLSHDIDKIELAMFCSKSLLETKEILIEHGYCLFNNKEKLEKEKYIEKRSWIPNIDIWNNDFEYKTIEIFNDKLEMLFDECLEDDLNTCWMISDKAIDNIFTLDELKEIVRKYDMSFMNDADGTYLKWSAYNE